MLLATKAMIGWPCDSELEKLRDDFARDRSGQAKRDCRSRPGDIASAMAVPLFKHQGFTSTDIATIAKVFGFWIALGGTFMAGWWTPRIGMMASLVIGAVAGSTTRP